MIADIERLSSRSKQSPTKGLDTTADIVPYSITDMAEYPRSSTTPVLTRLGQAQGIYIALHPDTVADN